VTFAIECSYELKHRIYGKDFRRIMFIHQEELLSQLNQSWGERRRLEHEQILKRSPFDDYGSIRATFCKDLRDQGYSVEEARKIAYSKYPLPKEPES
jgi:hypothetical protein